MYLVDGFVTGMSVGENLPRKVQGSGANEVALIQTNILELFVQDSISNRAGHKACKIQCKSILQHSPFAQPYEASGSSRALMPPDAVSFQCTAESLFQNWP